MNFKKLQKLKRGDKVAILSPSFAAPGKWSHVYQLGLQRVREVFELEPIEFPTTSKIGATTAERSKDLVDAFENKEIKAVIASLGGNDQVTYIKNLPSEPFVNNPKPFLGFSDNTHFMNHLWLNGIPSYYGGALFTQFAMQGKMDEFTVNYLKKALFEDGEHELLASEIYNDIDLDWNDPENLKLKRYYEPNENWYWDGNKSSEGITWGGCVESIDEMLRHGVRIPTLEQFEGIILFAETSEEVPDHQYTKRVFRALGERGILERLNGIIIGRPKAWLFDKPSSTKEKKLYQENQRDAILETVRNYNHSISVVQNLDFGHTDPQICLPMGMKAKIDVNSKTIKIIF